MMREEFKNDQYFEGRIDELCKFIKEDVEELEQGKIKKSQISTVSIGNFNFSLSVIYAMYSAGYSKDEINSYYSQAVDLISSQFNEWEGYFKPSIPDFRLHDILMMLSLGVLLDAPPNQIAKIIEVVDLAPERYRLLDYFISYFDKTREVSSTIRKSEHAFEEFSKLLDLSNEDIFSKNLMGSYLETWYENEDRVHMHDTHNIDLDNYYGYWSFESAAFVKIRGLDDSAFRDTSPFYPKDLL